MKQINEKLVVVSLAVSLILVTAGLTFAQSEHPNLLGKKTFEIKRGFSKEALTCIECHTKKMPGTVDGWRKSNMSHAGVSCYDCHTVEKSSPMASQCEGLKGTDTYISPMVSSKTCSRCHPTEVEQFLKSGHAKLASSVICDPKRAGLIKLAYQREGAAFMDNVELDVSSGLTPEGQPPLNRASRASGCQMCHGTQVEMGPDNKPINETWPGGVGTRYPDGSIGTCTVCHTRHTFDIAEARKPEACASCHLGPDHPDIEIYLSSKHGQQFQAHGEDWNFDSAPDTWEPGDYTAPTCAVCHMSGIGELSTTHNINDRLKWDLMHKKSVIRSGVRGDGEKGDKLMRKVCANCHGSAHIQVQMTKLDNTVALYNKYWDGAVKMKKELKEKGLLKKDPWRDGFQELMYYLWHHTGRRAKQGTAMNGPDYSHWHGFFQIFQVYQDMEEIYKDRLKNNKIEELSHVMSSAPY
ncbi:MAG: multiheme c-type cytochrome [Thermodesulfobacteriota bacterium]|nr:multiheme c-type cytochrome [Thermodesulfobacteriota bacterium]